MKQKFRKLFLIAAIGLGLLAGSPMRPDEIAELLQRLNKPKIVQLLRDETDQDNLNDPSN